MIEQWKSAIRIKRKATYVKYLKNKTQENWEYKRKCRNEATRQLRWAIKKYWKRKLMVYGQRTVNQKSEISLNVHGNTVEDHTSIVEFCADHFATIAGGIGDIHAQQSPDDDFSSHPSVQRIAEGMKNSPGAFQFQRVNKKQVLESLSTKRLLVVILFPPKR